jgi:hypothetical protein
VRAAATTPPPGDLPVGAEPVRLDPANSTTRIDNPWWPTTPGSRWVHTDTEGGARPAIPSLDEQVEAPFGHFSPALLTKELTPLEPRALEYKLHAKGVGLVISVGVSGDPSREALVSYRKGGG